MTRVLPPALRHRDFRLFWTGAMLSSSGSQFTTVAMAWQIYELTNSPLQIGLIGLARAVPQVALALLGGFLADALDRRRLLMVAQVGQLAVSIGLAVLTISSKITPEILVIAAVLLALGSAIETPTRYAIVPNLIPLADLSSAVALYNAQRSLGSIIGPSLAGLALALVGPALCYIVDASSWLFMLLALGMMRGAPLERVRTPFASFGAVLGGLRFVRSQPVILSFMVLDFGMTFFGQPGALMPVFARDILAVGPVGLGLLYAAPSVGAILAAGVMSTGRRPRDVGKAVIYGAVVYGLSNAAFAYCTVFVLSLFALAVAGAGNMMSSVMRGMTNQTLTPDELRGRVAAVNNAFVTGGPQLGQFRAGAVAGLWGAEASAATGGIGAVCIAIAIAAVPGIMSFRLEKPDPARSAQAPHR